MSQKLGYTVKYDACGKCLHFREEHPFHMYCMVIKHTVDPLKEACEKYDPNYDVIPGKAGRDGGEIKLREAIKQRKKEIGLLAKK